MVAQEGVAHEVAEEALEVALDEEVPEVVSDPEEALEVPVADLEDLIGEDTKPMNSLEKELNKLKQHLLEINQEHEADHIKYQNEIELLSSNLTKCEKERHRLFAKCEEQAEEIQKLEVYQTTLQSTIESMEASKHTEIRTQTTSMEQKISRLTEEQERMQHEIASLKKNTVDQQIYQKTCSDLVKRDHLIAEMIDEINEIKTEKQALLDVFSDSQVVSKVTVRDLVFCQLVGENRLEVLDRLLEFNPEQRARLNIPDSLSEDWIKFLINK